MDQQLFFLTPNIKHTTDALLNFRLEYNSRLELDKDYNKRTLKACHIHTAIELVRMYYKHIQNIGKSKVNNPGESYFEVNNVALGKRLGYAINYNKLRCTNECSTAYRHIEKLKQAGIITETFRHGSKRGKEIILNPELLIVELTADIKQRFTELYKQHINKQIALNDFVAINNLKLSFTDFLQGEISAPYIATCNDIDLTFYKNFKYKIECGSDFVAGLSLLQEQTGVNTKIELTIAGEAAAAKKDIPPAEISDSQQSAVSSQQSAANKQNVNNPVNSDKLSTNNEKLLTSYINMSWQTSFALLFYPFLGKNYNEPTQNSAKYLIKLFYERFSGGADIELLSAHELRRRLSIGYHEFFVRCSIKRRSLLKNPGKTFLNHPLVWLDPTFEYGFASTKGTFDNIMLQRKKNKDIYKNQWLVADLLKEYFNEPTHDKFRKAQQQLGKLKDKQYLQLYNECILKPADAKHMLRKKFQSQFA